MAAWAQSIWRWRLVPCGMLLCALLTGCASRGPAPDDAIVVTQTAAACRAYFALFDALVTRNHSADHQAARSADFPYLRVDRFLAAMAAVSSTITVTCRARNARSAGCYGRWVSPIPAPCASGACRLPPSWAVGISTNRIYSKINFSGTPACHHSHISNFKNPRLRPKKSAEEL